MTEATTTPAIAGTFWATVRQYVASFALASLAAALGAGGTIGAQKFLAAGEQKNPPVQVGLTISAAELRNLVCPPKPKPAREGNLWGTLTK